MDLLRHYTVIFLCDRLPPARMVILKRGANRPFAPNRYTGIGGKIEKMESPLAGAIRELEEETGLTGIPLTAFGRVVLNSGQVLHYFVGSDTQTVLPKSNEGALKRVRIGELFSYTIIPTTRVFLEQWKKRGWDTVHPFTVFITRDDPNNIDGAITAIRVEEGLCM